MSAPSVSVVIASYNRAAYLDRAVESVAAQTFADWECLVCDDGSTDGSIEVVRARESDSRFRLVTGPRAGLPASPRNRGVRQACGNWIAFLDDDDWWHPRKLERQLAIAQDHACEAISVRSVHYIEPETPSFAEVTGRADVQPLSLVNLLSRRGPMPDTSATMVRRNAIVSAGGFNESPSYRAVEDYELWVRLLAQPGFRWIVDRGDCLVAYRDQGEDSISAWSRVVDPDVIRQKWATVEIVTRALAESAAAISDRRAVLDALIRTADDCAGRCQIIGWPSAAMQAHLVSAVAALGGGRIQDAAVRGYRAIRSVLRGLRGSAAPTERVSVLGRSALKWGLSALVRTRRTRRSAVAFAASVSSTI